MLHRTYRTIKGCTCNKIFCFIKAVSKSYKDKLSSEKNESRACVASAQRISNQSEEVYQKLLETKSKLLQISKQKETSEKLLQNKISRLECENEKIKDRLRNKSGKLITVSSKFYLSCN